MTLLINLPINVYTYGALRCDERRYIEVRLALPCLVHTTHSSRPSVQRLPLGVNGKPTRLTPPSLPSSLHPSSAVAHPRSICVSTQVATRRQGTLKGGYVAKKEEGGLELIILAAGSEVQHAISAANAIGKGVRVVSIPSMYRFDKQSAEYKAEVLPSSCTKRVAMEVRFFLCLWPVCCFLSWCDRCASA